ncbi:aromatic-ring-hydroxylating dioxygenase subunit beta [Reyranella sp.]|uniref:aromatic-ring-hydroxylating dioxygenase subunit beta n=1 Tax=Reyranella sp. TaxID=1929291 RepID=UPI003BADB2BB
MDTIVQAGAVSEAQARRLLVDYAYAIDDGRLSEWPTFFTDPCLYRITTRQNEEQGLPLSIMLCDNHAMLYDRVEAIEKANVFEPHFYRHILSDSRIAAVAAEGLGLETSFICVRTMLDGRQSLFAAGVYRDHFVSKDGGCLLRSRTVVLDSSQVDTLLAIPL